MDETQVLQQALNLIVYEKEIFHKPAAGLMYGGYTPDKLKKMADVF